VVFLHITLISPLLPEGCWERKQARHAKNCSRPIYEIPFFTSERLHGTLFSPHSLPQLCSCTNPLPAPRTFPHVYAVEIVSVRMYCLHTCLHMCERLYTLYIRVITCMCTSIHIQTYNCPQPFTTVFDVNAVSLHVKVTHPRKLSLCTSLRLSLAPPISDMRSSSSEFKVARLSNKSS